MENIYKDTISNCQKEAFDKDAIIKLVEEIQFPNDGLIGFHRFLVEEAFLHKEELIPRTSFFEFYQGTEVLDGKNIEKIRRLEFDADNLRGIISLVLSEMSYYSKRELPEYNKALQNIMVDMLDGEFDEYEAKEELAKINRGIKDFEASIESNTNVEKFSVVNYLQKYAHHYDEEEQKDYYANVLASIDLLLENVDANCIEQYLKLHRVSSKDAILDNIDNGLSTLVSKYVGNEIYKKLIPEALIDYTGAIQEQKDIYTLVLAVCLCIEQKRGNLNLTDTVWKVSSYDLGLIASAAVDITVLNNQLYKKMIEPKDWENSLKRIICNVLGIQLGSMISTLLFWSTILSIFSASVITLFMASVMTSFMSVFGARDEETDSLNEDIINQSCDFYNNCISSFTCKVYSIKSEMGTGREQANQQGQIKNLIGDVDDKSTLGENENLTEEDENDVVK